MKKYDFYLLALYICLITIFFIIGCGFQRQEYREKKKAMDYFEKIYQTPIKTVILQHTDAQFVVRGPGENHLVNGLEFSGSFDISFLNHFKISGDTLVFSEVKGNTETPGFFAIRNLSIYVANDIKVDTINAPHVKFERPIIKKNGVQDGI